MIPELNKTYNCFDDGKITESRLYVVRIKEIIPFKEIDQETLTVWENEDCPWLYKPETDFFIKGHIIGETDDDDVIFVRTIDDGWFSLGWGGRLDIDGRLTKMLEDYMASICPICKGRGEVQQTDIDWDECRRCGGTGKVEIKK